jgi:hypothetical protein
VEQRDPSAPLHLRQDNSLQFSLLQLLRVNGKSVRYRIDSKYSEWTWFAFIKSTRLQLHSGGFKVFQQTMSIDWYKLRQIVTRKRTTFGRILLPKRNYIVTLKLLILRKLDIG